MMANPLMQDFARLQTLLGICLIAAAGLMAALWRERLSTVPMEERAKFLMYSWVGGAWLPAIFSMCGGVYLIYQSAAGT